MVFEATVKTKSIPQSFVFIHVKFDMASNLTKVYWM